MAEATVGLLRIVLASDSAQFSTGMDKAERTVVDFEKVTASAARSVARLVSDFNGTKIATEAAKMAAAIEKVGGVSSLTDAELGRVNRTIDTAVAKFKQLGQDVPPHITKLKDEIGALDRTTTQAAAPSGGLGMFQGSLGMIGKFLPGLSVAGAVAGMVGLGRAAFESADRLVTFADRVDVSIQTAQRWEYVAGQTGTSLDAFGASAFKLGVNIATGTDKVRSAVTSLGLSFDTVRSMKPEEQFDLVIKSLEGVESAQERNRLGVLLFGKQFSEIAVAVAQGYTKMKDEASVASDAQVRAAEAAGDAWERFKQKVGSVTLGAVGRVAQEFMDTAASVDSLTEAENQAFIAATKLGNGHLYLIDLQRERMRGQKDYNLSLDAGAKATTNYVAALSANQQAAAALRQEYGAQLDAALKLHGASEEVAAAFNTTVDVLRIYQEQVSDSAKQTKTLADEKRKAAEEAKKFTDAVKSSFKAIVPFQQAVEDTATSVRRLGGEMSDLASGSLLEYGTQQTQAREEALKWAQANGAVLAPSIRQVSAETESAGGSLAKLIGLGEDTGATLQHMAGMVVQAWSGDEGATYALRNFAEQGIGSLLSMIPYVGPFVASFAGPITDMLARLSSRFRDWVNSMFGGQHKKVNDLRDAAFNAAGGFAELHQKLHAAGFSMERLLKAKDVKTWEREWAAATVALKAHEAALAANTAAASTLFDEIMAAGRDGIPAAYRPAVDQLIALGLLTDEQADKLRGLGDAGAVNIDKMERAIGVFKGRTDSLGDGFKQAKITETAREYINAIEDMKAGGADMGMVLDDAKEELAALALQALKTGKALPANLKPYVDELAASNRIVDEHGEAITDLSGLKWGDAIETQGQKSERMWEKIIASIERLVTHIAGPLENAIDHVTRDREVDIDVNYRERGTRGGNESQPEGDPGLTVGTMGRFGKWFHNFGQHFPTSLHNVEAVLRPQDAMPFALDTLAAGGVAGGGETTTNLVLVPVLMGQDMDPASITDAIVRRIPTNISFQNGPLRTGIEQIVGDWHRSYGKG